MLVNELNPHNTTIRPNNMVILLSKTQTSNNNTYFRLYQQNKYALLDKWKIKL